MMEDSRPRPSEGATEAAGETSVVENREKLGHEEDFAALFEASQAQDKRVYRDAKVEGTIVSIGEEWIFVDIGAKSEGSIAKEEFLDKTGQPTVQVGDPITAYVLNSREGEILLSVKMTAAASEEAVRGAYRSGVPVEGVVTAERKGGYTVTVLGKQAFCPFSQMDIHAGGTPQDYIGKRFSFRIAEYSEGGRNIVISRRALLEEEQAERVARLKQSLTPGDVVEGTVKNLVNFGAFVDIGGIEGLIPMSELAWYRVENVGDILSVGDRVTVKILTLDWAGRRISLSLKQTGVDPWSSVSERYAAGGALTGKVTRLANFGAFVELEPGIDGLVHVSEMGTGRRITHPKEVVTVGELVEVRVLSVDPEARRISLELAYASGGEEAESVPELMKGALVKGTVESVTDFGVFVGLPGRRTGLVHISESGCREKADMRKRFEPGSTIDVEILDVDPAGKRISLSVKTLQARGERDQFDNFRGGQATGKSFGTLGDIFKDKFKR
ncbi:MAG: 30S ribosomal protein S1 [Pseudomonadota bacterium]